MRYLILSDIHANLSALDAVLTAAPVHDHVLMLGDLVGYGADPNEVIDRVRSFPSVTMIRGNHDKVGAGLEPTDGFNYLAKHAIAWTASTLTPEHRRWLAALPQGPSLVDDDVEICHGTPFDEDVYVFDDLDAARSVRAQDRWICFFGHTHVPAAFSFSDQLARVPLTRDPDPRIALDPTVRYLINCGAVGQPRDGDPRAAFGLLDLETKALTMHRVAYDVASAQRRILAAGLPDVLAERLARGR